MHASQQHVERLPPADTTAGATRERVLASAGARPSETACPVDRQSAAFSRAASARRWLRHHLHLRERHHPTHRSSAAPFGSYVDVLGWFA